MPFIPSSGSSERASGAQQDQEPNEAREKDSLFRSLHLSLGC
jgi:hypothetical protein